MNANQVSGMSRRDFVRIAGVWTAGLAAAGGCTSLLTPSAKAQPEGARPNILFIIGDDWSWPHVGVYGEPIARTPVLDELARQGMAFNHAYVPAPSCSPCRASLLSGLYPHRLGTGMNLSGPLPADTPLYPPFLERAGYHVGYTGKGYGPAWLDPNRAAAAGQHYPDFKAFLAARPQGRPFMCWLGPKEPHRKYNRENTARYGPTPEQVPVPPYLPDAQAVREDLADYFAEIRMLDEKIGDWLKTLQDTGEADNTIVIVTGDNGLPFPRAKTTLYDSGTRVPLIVRWPGRVPAGRVSDAMVNLVDVTATLYELAGVEPPAPLDGRSLLPLLMRGDESGRDAVFTERDTHVPHSDGRGYPMRAVRTHDYLYIRNLEPDRWPSGPPDQISGQFPSGHVDIDDGPAKKYIVARMKEELDYLYGRLAFAHRPAEELYDVRKDPHQMHNLAAEPAMQETRARMAAMLDEWMARTKDPAVARP